MLRVTSVIEANDNGSWLHAEADTYSERLDGRGRADEPSVRVELPVYRDAARRFVG